MYFIYHSYVLIIVAAVYNNQGHNPKGELMLLQQNIIFQAQVVENEDLSME